VEQFGQTTMMATQQLTTASMPEISVQENLEDAIYERMIIITPYKSPATVKAI
jgi:hypothetical protein